MAAWKIALLFALLIFSGYSALQVINDEDINSINFNNQTSLPETAFCVIATPQSLNNVVPSIRYNLPGIEGYVLPLNDIPFLDGTDLFIMIPLLFIPYLIMQYKVKKYKKWSKEWFKIYAIWFLLIIIAFFITKFIYYQIFLQCGQKLGFSLTKLIEIREQFLANTEGSKFVLLIISLISGYAILSSSKKRKKK
ncbi:hypothetical protein K8R33_02890 [archaeon]|nr:hypothetical protein [archaeon]